jgi:hypothetical protein
LFKSVFGKEFVIGAMRCEIAADSVPDTSGPIDAITLAPDIDTSRHGIYRHPQSVSEIVGWNSCVFQVPQADEACLHRTVIAGL